MIHAGAVIRSAGAIFTAVAITACSQPQDGTGGEGGAGGATGATHSHSSTDGFPVASSASQTQAQQAQASTGATAQFCPSAEPANGEGCPLVGLVCPIGVDQCTCEPGGWSCLTCPSVQPAQDQPCPGEGSQCTYGPLTCTCAATGWDCGTCPDRLPDDQTDCGCPGLGCDYGEGVHCACNAGLWTCLAPCPLAAPEPGSACVLGTSQECVFDRTTCICFQHQYFCN